MDLIDAAQEAANNAAYMQNPAAGESLLNGTPPPRNFDSEQSRVRGALQAIADDVPAAKNAVGYIVAECAVAAGVTGLCSSSPISKALTEGLPQEVLDQVSITFGDQIRERGFDSLAAATATPESTRTFIGG